MTIELAIEPPPIQAIRCDLLDAQSITLRVLRLDLIHASINGNKWFKLKQNLVEAERSGLQTIVSFGGAYSNHLRALAAAGSHFGFKTIGLVRGEIVQPLNPVLHYAQSQGMKLLAMSRSDYRNKYAPELLEQLKGRFGNFHLIPEGGSNELGVAGCADIVSWLKWTENCRQKKIVATACGTGATLAGLIRGLENSDNPLESPEVENPEVEHPEDKSNTQVIGIAVLKGASFLVDRVNQWLQTNEGYANGPTKVAWEIYTDYHAGGYAKCNQELEGFLQWFSQHTSLPVEPVYTGKLFYGIFELIKAQKIPPNSEILALHTGGLQ